MRVEFRDGGTEVECSRTLNLPIVRDPVRTANQIVRTVAPPTTGRFANSGLSVTFQPSTTTSTIYLLVEGGELVWASSGNARDFYARIICGTTTVAETDMEANPSDHFPLTLSGIYTSTSTSQVTCNSQWHRGAAVSIVVDATHPVTFLALEV